MKTTQKRIQKRTSLTSTFIFVSIIYLVMFLLSAPNNSEGQSFSSLSVPKLDTSILPIRYTDIPLYISFTIRDSVRYGTIKVELLDSTVTDHRGSCINSGSGTSKDLRLRSTNNANWTYNQTDGSLTRSVTSETMSPISVHIYCEDNAAYGEVKVTLTLDTGVVLETTQKIPRDDNGNKIADGWENDAIKNYVGNEDAETGPAATTFSDELGVTHNIIANTHDGDGLTVFDEYRGAMLKGYRTPTRFSPDTKDIFIKHNSTDLAFYECGNGSGFPFSCWVIDTASVIVNPNTAGGNKGVIAIEISSDPQTHEENDQGEDVLIDKYGDAGGRATVPDPFGDWPTVTIYTQRIASDLLPPDTIPRIISHEIGHCVNLGHCGVAIPMDSYCIMHPYYDENRTQFGVHHNPDYDLIHPHNAPLIDQDIRPEETSTNIISTNTGHSSYGCDHNSQYDYCTDTGNCGQPTDSHTNGLCGHRWCICAAAAPSESTTTTTTTTPTVTLESSDGVYTALAGDTHTASLSADSSIDYVYWYIKYPRDTVYTELGSDFSVGSSAVSMSFTFPNGFIGAAGDYVFKASGQLMNGSSFDKTYTVSVELFYPSVSLDAVSYHPGATLNVSVSSTNADIYGCHLFVRAPGDTSSYGTKIGWFGNSYRSTSQSLSYTLPTTAASGQYKLTVRAYPWQNGSYGDPVYIHKYVNISSN